MSVAHLVNEPNLLGLVQVLEEFEASPDLLRSMDPGQKQRLSESLKKAIWEKFPVLTRVRDQPGNEDSYYWFGKLFAWDWSRIKLFESPVEKAKAMTEFAFQPEGEPLVIGYPNVIRHFMQKYIATGATEHRAEASKLVGVNPAAPSDEFARLREKESLLPIAKKGSMRDVEAVMQLMQRRSKLSEEFKFALEGGKITREQFLELNRTNRLHSLGATDISEVPAELRKLVESGE